jgi:hypothetical protein
LSFRHPPLHEIKKPDCHIDFSAIRLSVCIKTRDFPSQPFGWFGFYTLKPNIKLNLKSIVFYVIGFNGIRSDAGSHIR